MSLSRNATWALAAIFGLVGAIPGYAQHSHEGHHQHAEVPLKRAEVKVDLPRIKATRHDGQSVTLADDINDGRIVALQFMYTTCTTICPVTSRTFAQVQRKLQKDIAKVHLISVSIDPEHDTVTRLADYARQIGAGASWHFYTGSVDASIMLQRAFDSYRGDKMNHLPLTFVRRSPGGPWVRLEGLQSADAILKELMPSRAAGS